MTTDEGQSTDSADQPQTLPVDVTVAFINYNGISALPRALRAIKALNIANLTVFVMDDGSTDDSVAWVKQHYPAFHVIELGQNSGKCSVPRNHALKQATTPYVLLLDHDVTVMPGCIETLLEAIQSRPNVLCCTPRLVFDNDPDRIYLDGGSIHYLCISARLHRGIPIADRPPREPISAVGGGNMLVDRQMALKMGGFDSDYMFGWGEDAEMPARARLAGMVSLHVTRAVAHHEARPHGTTRAEAQLYNRLRWIVTQYHRRTIVLLAPMFAVMELMLMLATAALGQGGKYWRAWGRVCRDRHELACRRAAIQKTRRVSDADLLEGGAIATAGKAQQYRILKLAVATFNLVARSYWTIVRPFLWRPGGKQSIEKSNLTPGAELRHLQK